MHFPQPQVENIYLFTSTRTTQVYCYSTIFLVSCLAIILGLGSRIRRTCHGRRIQQGCIEHRYIPSVAFPQPRAHRKSTPLHRISRHLTSNRKIANDLDSSSTPSVHAAFHRLHNKKQEEIKVDIENRKIIRRGRVWHCSGMLGVPRDYCDSDCGTYRRGEDLQ